MKRKPLICTYGTSQAIVGAGMMAAIIAPAPWNWVGLAVQCVAIGWGLWLHDVITDFYYDLRAGK